MKFSATASAFAAALDRALLAVDDRPKAVPTLGVVVVTATGDGTVQLRATDLNRVVEATVEAEVEVAGTAAIPARRLASLVAGFPKDATVRISAGATGAEIRAGRSRYRLQTLPLDDVPPPLAIGGDVGGVEMPAAALLRLLKRPMVAASVEETRYYLNGIYLHSTDGRLTAVGTDGGTLVRVTTDTPPPSMDGIIVPLSTIKPLVRLLGHTKPDAAIRLRWSNTLVEVSTLTWSLTSRLVDGVFPDYGRIIPAATSNYVVVDRSELAAALVRLAAISDMKADRGAAALRWSDGEAVMEIRLADRADDGTDEIATIEASGAAEIGLAVGALIEICNQIAGERICVDGSNGMVRLTDLADTSLLVVRATMAVRHRAADKAA